MTRKEWITQHKESDSFDEVSWALANRQVDRFEKSGYDRDLVVTKVYDLYRECAHAS